MRPVDRGPVPLDGHGNPKVFGRYQDARGDLIERLGEYCSYCGTRLPASLAVEHIKPKGPNPEYELKWDNFLLGCTNCNSTKGDKDVQLNKYYWPHADNTFRAFEYAKGGVVRVNVRLTRAQQRRAQNTIDLTGLDRTPANDRAASDRRWQNRLETWGIAKESHQDLNRQDNEELRTQIVRTAVAQGFWSVWMTVFAEDEDMLQRFVEAFPGTCKDCFDENYHPVPRPGGAL